MIRALYTAATGLEAQQLNIDVIANNLANVSTSGFKKSRADFQDLLYQTSREPGGPATSTTQSSTGIQVGLGVRPAAVQRINSQGDFNQTTNPLDVAISGDGYFQVTLPDGSTALHACRGLQARLDRLGRDLLGRSALAADQHSDRRRVDLDRRRRHGERDAARDSRRRARWVRSRPRDSPTLRACAPKAATSSRRPTARGRRSSARQDRTASAS